MRILIITDSYPPEVRSSSHLMKEMADGLRERGHEVFVATSFPQHHVVDNRGLRPGLSVEDGIKVIHSKVLPHHNVNFILKGISQVTLPYIFFRDIRRNISEKIDAVFVHSPPLPLAIAADLVKKRYGARFFLNLQDFFPQNAVDLGVLNNKLLIWFFERMEFWAYRKSDVIVTPSDGHKAFLNEKRGVPLEKIHVVSHWIDAGPFIKAKRTGRFRKMYGLEDKFIFLFAGVFGPSQGLDMFIKIASKMKNHEDVVFLFVGDGSEKNKLAGLTDSLGLKNVRFEPLVSKEDYPWLVKDADVGLVSLTSENTTPAVPAKLMGYMAASIPVLALLHKESDGVKIVREAKCGMADLSDDDAKALEMVLKIYKERRKLGSYGKNGFDYLMANFTKDICIDKLEELFLESVL